MLLHLDLVHANTESFFLGSILRLREKWSEPVVCSPARPFGPLNNSDVRTTCRRHLQPVAKTSLQAFVVAQVMQRGARLGVCKVLKLGLQLID